MMTPKKRKTVSSGAKRGKQDEKEPQSYPDADPEWEHLEERYSNIGSEMRSLAKLLNVSGDGSDQA